jgi:predicted HicB family RNase H-like nuclease
MNIRPNDTRRRTITARAISSLFALAVLLLIPAGAAFAQKSITRKYPAQKNVRFEMKNISGTITVEAWDKNEIQVTAKVYSPNAQFTPEQTADCLGIDVVRDNRGRMVGDINFRVKVPVNSTVNIETRRGNISINNIRGEMVRARVSTSGDIELAGIRAGQVIAEGGTGDIFFDGELAPGGSYTFKALSGNINIRIPANSSFSLVANAQPESIWLNSFASPGLSYVVDGRKVYGNVGGDGPRATLTIFNQRGKIVFDAR